jgi:hypothetical protein
MGGFGECQDQVETGLDAQEISTVDEQVDKPQQVPHPPGKGGGF